MPSGRHSGSPGSHSSGGSSRGSSSSGRSNYSKSSNSYNNSRSSHRGSFAGEYILGRYYHVGHGSDGHVHHGTHVSGRVFACIVFIIFGLIMSILGTCIRTSAVNKIDKIKSDYSYYQELIKHARENDYIVEGKVEDMFFNPDADKYYIIYRIEYDFPFYLEGYSYSVYTLEEAMSLMNKTIRIAVQSVPVTEYTDSVPMDYENMPLKRDGEYTNAVSELKVGTVLMSVGFILLALSIAGVITFSVLDAKKKKAEQDESQIEKNKNATVTKSRYCAYCGSKLGENERQCQACGARNKI